MFEKSFLFDLWLLHVGPGFPGLKKFSISLTCSLIFEQLNVSHKNWIALSLARSAQLGEHLLRRLVLQRRVEVPPKCRLGPIKWKGKRGQKKRKRNPIPKASGENVSPETVRGGEF